jgi:hypothetical protein
METIIKIGTTVYKSCCTEKKEHGKKLIGHGKKERGGVVWLPDAPYKV